MKTYKTTRVSQEMMATGLFHDEQQALNVFNASLLALRDRLAKDEAFQLGTQLPMEFRDFYFKGWNAVKRQAVSVNKSEFLAEVAFHLRGFEDYSLDDLVPVALHLLLNMISENKAEHLKHVLPVSMRNIFDDRLSMD